MDKKKITIRKLLQRELDRCYHATAIKMDVGDLFCKESVVKWVQKRIGLDDKSPLAEKIENASEERLGHTVSAYLLGMAIRNNLNLHFDLLPKVVAKGAGDGFHFFWAMICLCHDLGYTYEKGNYDLSKMKTPEGRRELLHIQHDLLQVDEETLDQLGIEARNGEREWILQSIELARKYDAYRRQEWSENPDQPVIDHGIAGALILYDVLYRDYEQLVIQRRFARKGVTRNDPATKPVGLLEGVEKDSPAARFIRCGLVIACTVARHNMWISSPDRKAVYEQYGLSELVFDAPNAKVRASSSAEQMLFLLGFVDTIDIVKVIYTRAAEKGTISSYELERRKQFVLDQVNVEFYDAAHDGYRWRDCLTFRRFTVSVKGNDRDGWFTHYMQDTEKLTEWLITKKPIVEGTGRICYFIPSYSAKRNIWPGGITDQEVNALLLYEGCGVPGKYGDFYSLSSPYQTLNLLMMPGEDGEQIRVCQEGQTPHCLYVKEWKKTLEVMTDIFTAMCKYAVYRRELGVEWDGELVRGDREMNFILMKDRHETFALTSTSKEAVLPQFLQGKINPQLLKITIGKTVPYFDYSGFFGDEYIFFDEQEVLLPPYISVEISDSVIGGKEFQNISCHNVHLTCFNSVSVDVDELELVDYLEENCGIAAQGLEALAEKRDISKALPKGHLYWEWKKKFQQLCRLCMQSIHRAYFDDTI